MKAIETEFNEYGWKLIVKKSKDGIITIAQRSNGGYHMIHKPMELRLQPRDFKKLKILIREISKKDEDKK